MVNEVLIMMATYNGMEYLEEQLLSIIHQDYTCWKLIVRDDGSSDETIRILEKYSQADNRISYIQNDTDYHGAYHNFFSLLNYVKKQASKFDYFMFADQDDVWDKNKISVLLDNLCKKDEKVPTLIYADMRLIDAENKLISSSIDQELGIAYTNRISTFFAHKVFGCNTMFNRALLNLLPEIPLSNNKVSFLSHDNFVTKCAAVFGEIYYLSTPLMGYRRYGGNVTSAHEYNFSFSRIAKRILSLENLAKDHALTYKQTLFMIELIRGCNQLTVKQDNTLKLVKQIIDKGGIYALYSIIKHKISWNKTVKTVSRSLILFIKSYKHYLS